MDGTRYSKEKKCIGKYKKGGSSSKRTSLLWATEQVISRSIQVKSLARQKRKESSNK
jgi:hypothetical protein